MGILERIRKGFGFVLMSMGVSTYAKKPQPPKTGPPPPVKPD